MDIRKVHVVFKTHLDIGFTDFSANVTAHYLNRFIPGALRIAGEANKPGQPRRFVWTVGSFIVDLALRTLGAEDASALDAAVRRGDITYHALPFTTHSELCSGELFRAGLGITGRLDARFGRRTIAAKMSDVPGHTVGILAPLAEQGIEFLHIGINGCACMPEVPPLFMWENEQGQQVMVNYARSYGGLTVLDGYDEALYFLHNDDNAGPPSLERLQEAFAEIQARFPWAEVFASTLDAFAIGLRPLRGRLPVIRGEIGDTWIHGIGTDPKKTAMLREMDRLSRKWDQEGFWDWHTAPLPDGRLPRAAFLEGLLLVCEHTWGLDAKKFLTDFVNWNRADFDKARAKNVILDSYAAGTAYDDTYRYAKSEFERVTPENLRWEQRSYSLFEKSHQEQRDYVAQAIGLLPQPMRDQAESKLRHMDEWVWPEAASTVVPARSARLGAWQAMLKGDEITLLTPSGHALAFGLPLYQEVGTAAYERLGDYYLNGVRENLTWAIADNMKLGLERSDAPREDFLHWPAISCSALQDGVWHLEGRFNPNPQRLAGCPEGFRMRFSPCPEGVMVSLLLYGKPANRKPEAMFLPVYMQDAKGLRVRKIGQWVDPSACVRRGNQRVHGMDAFEWTDGKGRQVRVDSLQAPLLVIGEPKLLDFECAAAFDRIYITLFNNLWGTNFKMWYEEDIFCQFLIGENDAVGSL